MRALRIFHSADWHLGKGLGNLDRTEDFKALTDAFLARVSERRPDVVLLAGDIFDTAMPGNVAQTLYFKTVSALSRLGVKATVITAGNHDSQRFLSAPVPVLKVLNIFVAGPTPDQQVFVLRDDSGEPELAVAAVPYLRDGDVRRGGMGMSDADRTAAFEKGVADRYREVAGLIDRALDGKRVPRIAMGHLFVTGAQSGRSEAGKPRETVSVGSLDNVPARVFGSDWDYVALGHIHSGGRVSADVPMYYAGCPMPFDFHHADYDTGVLEINIDETGAVDVQKLPLPKPRAFYCVSGGLAALTEQITAIGKAKGDGLPPFVRAHFTEPEDVADLAEKLRETAQAAGVTLVAVRNEVQAAQYRRRADAKINLADVTPEDILKSAVAEHYEDPAVRASVLADYLPRFNEALSEIACGRDGYGKETL